MTDQQKVREAFFREYPGARENFDLPGVQALWRCWQAALAHASSARGEECSIDHVASGGKLMGDDAARWRELCRQIDASDPVSNEASTIRNIVDDAINLGSTCLGMHIDQAIAGRRGEA